MGKRHRKLLDSSYCIYCGGLKPADTVDHVPPIAMFDNRVRPKGLEFPSCEACNAGTRKSELLAALVGRAYPDRDGEDFKAELAKLFDGLSSNVPGLLEELYPSRASAKFASQRLGNSAGGLMRLSGPMATAHLQAFAAKLGFAFHFHATGKPVPLAGGVMARVFSNIDAIEGRIPNDIFEAVGPPRTLVQGAIHVGDQFRFSTTASDEGTISMGFASFRKAFSVTTFAADDPAKLLIDGEHPTRVFRPGDLERAVPSPEFISIKWGVRNL